MPSTGTYEQNPPGVVVTVTDTGGGDHTRDVAVSYRWKPSKVIVGAPSRRRGLTINRARGRCSWKVLGVPLGTERFKLRMRSNGSGASKVVATASNKRDGRTVTYKHTITIPNAAAKKPRRKARKKA